MVCITLEGSSQSPGDQAHVVWKAPGLSAGVTVTYTTSISPSSSGGFSVMAFFFLKIQEEVRDAAPSAH